MFLVNNTIIFILFFQISATKMHNISIRLTMISKKLSKIKILFCLIKSLFVPL